MLLSPQGRILNCCATKVLLSRSYIWKRNLTKLHTMTRIVRLLQANFKLQSQRNIANRPLSVLNKTREPATSLFSAPHRRCPNNSSTLCISDLSKELLSQGNPPAVLNRQQAIDVLSQLLAQELLVHGGQEETVNGLVVRSLHACHRLTIGS